LSYDEYIEKTKGGIMKDLTQQELAVLILVAEGKTNNQIAENLFISYHTVKAHLESIYFKLGVANRVQAALKAYINRLIDVECIKSKL
jgi:NarL family two-component system response regulator LiaR